MYETSSTAYGAHYATLPNAQRRPKGTEIGTCECSSDLNSRTPPLSPARPRYPSQRAHSPRPPRTARPWPTTNERNLAPRVPDTWLLERRTGCLEIPKENLKAFKPPSSQRCAASGFSAHLQVTPFNDRFSAVKDPSASSKNSPRDVWWSLSRMADVGPRWYGS